MHDLSLVSSRAHLGVGKLRVAIRRMMWDTGVQHIRMHRCNGQTRKDAIVHSGSIQYC